MRSQKKLTIFLSASNKSNKNIGSSSFVIVLGSSFVVVSNKKKNIGSSSFVVVSNKNIGSSYFVVVSNKNNR